jgi:sirohydrochlorin ferrochelatase
MQAILYIGHGTRLAKGVAQCKAFIEQVKQQIPLPIQETAFLELVEPSIEEGVKRCIEQGATKIAIIPLLLLTAHHAKLDIPKEFEAIHSQYPTIQFTFGKPLGIEKSIVMEVIDKVQQAINTQESENWQTRLTNGEADVLLVVRGSSDPGLAQQANEICQLVKKYSHYKYVKACFLYGNDWRFEDALSLYSTCQKPVVIIPYLLFDGLLSVAIEKKVQQAQEMSPNVLLADKLGSGENVQFVLRKRIDQCIQIGGVYV